MSDPEWVFKFTVIVWLMVLSIFLARVWGQL
jgi:hypothetical protein